MTRRWARLLGNVLLGLSAALAVVSASLWVRGYVRTDVLSWGRALPDVIVDPGPDQTVVPIRMTFELRWGRGSIALDQERTCWDSRPPGLGWNFERARDVVTECDPVPTWWRKLGFGYYDRWHETGPYAHRQVAMSLRFATAVFGLAPVARLAWWLTRGRRIAAAPGVCPGCGYDLRASPDRCPECGRAAGELAGRQRSPARVPTP